MADELLGSVKIVREGSVVRVLAKAKADARQILGLAVVMPAIAKTKQAATMSVYRWTLVPRKYGKITSPAAASIGRGSPTLLGRPIAHTMHSERARFSSLPPKMPAPKKNST